MSSAAGFQFRGACEPCHRRKIRCIIPPGESSCTLCTHSGIACLFAPRRKPGRPKRLGSSNSAAAPEKQPSPTSRQWSSSESPPPVEMKHEAPPMPEMDNNPMPDMNNTDSMNVFWSSLSSGDESYVNTANWGDAATQLSYAHHDHSSMNCIPESMQYSLSQPVPGMQRSDSYSTFGSMPDMSHGSFQSRSIPSSTAATTDNDVSFDTTMQLCKDLHEYRSHVSRRPSFSPSVHHNLFHDMLRMCTAATNMPPQNTSGPACPATALVLAAMLQFLDVCGLIISRLSDSSSISTPASTHLENMFLLRKMDLVLLPTKLFLSDKGHHAGVARAQALHHEIEAVISNEYPQLAWGDGQGMLTASQGEMFQQQM